MLNSLYIINVACFRDVFHKCFDLQVGSASRVLVLYSIKLKNLNFFTLRPVVFQYSVNCLCVSYYSKKYPYNACKVVFLHVN